MLVFSNSAPFEAKRKALLGKGRFTDNRKVHQAFITSTKAELDKTALPIFWFDESLQKGANFSERITHAVQSLFVRGVERLVVVGTDTPLLSAQLVLKAVGQTGIGKTVIGPSKDGGVYLMALHTADFKANKFTKLPWQRKSLCKKLVALTAKSGLCTILLKPLRDVDIVQDLFQFIRISKSKLSRFLAQLIHLRFYNPEKPTIALAYLLNRLLPSRAPPVL